MAKDYTTLSNPRSLYFAETHRPFPEWAANAPLPTAESFEKCAAAAFADPERRLLPIRDKVSTFHSAIDLFANASDYTVAVFDRVKSACDFYGISDDVAPYADVFADKLEKIASADSLPAGRYAIDQDINGFRYQLLPLNDAQDVSDSAHELAKMASEGRIHFLTLIPAAQQIVKAAEDLGCEVTLLISRLGLERCADMDKAAYLIGGREKFAKNATPDDVKAEYEAIIASGKSGESSPQLCMHKIAALDDAVGIRYRYHEAAPIMTAAEIIFSGPLVSEVEKTARHNVAIKDVLVPLSIVQSIDTSEASYKLSKTAGHTFNQLHASDDAKDLSLAIMDWDDADQRTLLRMAAAAV